MIPGVEVIKSSVCTLSAQTRLFGMYREGQGSREAFQWCSDSAKRSRSVESKRRKHFINCGAGKRWYEEINTFVISGKIQWRHWCQTWPQDLSRFWGWWLLCIRWWRTPHGDCIKIYLPYSAFYKVFIYALLFETLENYWHYSNSDHKGSKIGGCCHSPMLLQLPLCCNLLLWNNCFWYLLL